MLQEKSRNQTGSFREFWLHFQYLHVNVCPPSLLHTDLYHPLVTVCSSQALLYLTAFGAAGSSTEGAVFWCHVECSLFIVCKVYGDKRLHEKLYSLAPCRLEQLLLSLLLAMPLPLPARSGDSCAPWFPQSSVKMFWFVSNPKRIRRMLGFVPKQALLFISSFPPQEEFLLVHQLKLSKQLVCRNSWILATGDFSRVTSPQNGDEIICMWYKICRGALFSPCIKLAQFSKRPVWRTVAGLCRSKSAEVCHTY